MPNLCGKSVNYLGIPASKSGGGVSTALYKVASLGTRHSVQPAAMHRFFHFLTQPFSTVKLAPLPLSEHNFYPLSTVPITTTTKGKSKER